MKIILDAFGGRQCPGRGLKRPEHGGKRTWRYGFGSRRH